MTTPVALPAPAARPAAAARAEAPGRRAGAEPFASVLHGALAGRRPADDSRRATPAGQDRTDPSEASAGAATPGAAPARVPGAGRSGDDDPVDGTPIGDVSPGEVPTGGEPVVVIPVEDVPAGAVPAVEVAPGTEGVPVPPVVGGIPASGTPVAVGRDHAAGTAPGQAVAAARVQGRAIGLVDGVPPGRADGEVPPGGGTPQEGAGPAGSAGGGAGRSAAAGPLPATAAVAAQAQAQLRAALASAGTGPDGTGVLVPVGDVALELDAPGTVPVTPPPSGTPPVSTAQPATDAAMPAVTVGAPQGDGADRSGTSEGGTGEQTAGAAAPTSMSPPASATDADGATSPAPAPPVSTQLARQVAVLRGAADGSHTMTLVLTPETLGPVEVSVTVSSGALELTLRSASELGRAALLDAMPELRRDLEQAGVTVSRAEVDRDTGSRFSDQARQHAAAQQGFGDRSGQGRGDHRYRPWASAADTTSGPTPTAPRATSSGVDVRV